MHWYDWVTYEFPVDEHTKAPKRIGVAPLYTFPTGFFDGAADHGYDGASTILYINNDIFCHLKLSFMKATNIRVELLTLQYFLLFASYIVFLT